MATRIAIHLAFALSIVNVSGLGSTGWGRTLIAVAIAGVTWVVTSLVFGTWGGPPPERRPAAGEEV